MKTPLLPYEIGRRWRNWHATAGVGGPVQRIYIPRNLWQDGSKDAKAFLPGLAGLQQIVREAEHSHKRVRAMGSGWSLSNAAYTEDYLVNTSRLTHWFVGFRTPTMLTPQFRSKSQRLVFAQCGVLIKTLSAYLEARGLSLSTSGASNGQTIAGAISTGTHGAANAFGSIQESVLGLHMIAEGGKHYFIQRASRPAVSDEFCAFLGAEPRNDDALFQAALVSFGSFGIIHGVLFEASPLYWLERHVKRVDYAAVREVLGTLDVTSLQLPGGSALPFHLEIVLNPYALGQGQGGAFVRVLYKRPPGPSLPVQEPGHGQTIRSEDLVSVIGFFSDIAPGLIPLVLQDELEDSFPETPPQGILGTHSQQFGDTAPTNGGTSMEIGVPLDQVGNALTALLSVTSSENMAMPMSFRYVKQSDATLAFTCFAPHTCTIEIPTIDSVRTRDGFERIWAELRTRRIPHTFHYGQALPQHPYWLEVFGARRQQWLAARSSFLSASGRRMFSNAMLDALGLSG
ncbi:MAG TPA: FAD-binding protein [Polyangiales bacterium]|nr:FAD-binding protein [Polyangiales bacterium]